MKKIYLDYAAATPVDPRVLKVMEPYFSDKFHNPSATYLAARQVRKDLEKARGDVAGRLGAKPAEVVFTAGATEANNLAIQGIMRDFAGGEALVTAIEHESVLEPAGLFKYKKVPVAADGRILLNPSTSLRAGNLKDLISDKTVLVSIAYVNNEIGTVQPLHEIAALLAEKRQSRRRQNNRLPLYFHTDAAQAPNYFDIHVSRLGVDLMSINGGKIYGPKQSGALYVKAGIKLHPLIVGGGQEFNLRSGTENVAGAVGLAAALKLAQERRNAEMIRLSHLRNLFVNELEKALPNVTINGSKKHQAPHIISVTFPEIDNERLMMQLDEAGVQAATGSACAAARVEPSRVLSAIGLSDDEARATLRFSLGRQTTEADILKTVELLNKLSN
ncbi:cysteine desulfurase [Candidatus Saccharibacteria bacterium]|nr:cysteine desulfurase [Candidatus Saccharibacteria bacterium]